MSVEEIKKRSVVAVVRGASLATIIPIGKALKEGGVTALEITMETPKALAVIEKAADVFGDELLVGAFRYTGFFCHIGHCHFFHRIFLFQSINKFILATNHLFYQN